MARPKKWSGETTAIRVPANLAGKLLEIAQCLDTQSSSFVQNYEAQLITVDERRYLLPPVPITPQQSQMLDKMLDNLLLECKKVKVDPMAVLTEITPRICKKL